MILERADDKRDSVRKRVGRCAPHCRVSRPDIGDLPRFGLLARNDFGGQL